MEADTITVRDDAGNEVEQHNTISSVAGSVRQCSTCALGPACPSYQPGNSCAYNIPVVIRTKDQRQAVLRTLVEIQTQRILMGSFAEQVNGQPDALVGRRDGPPVQDGGEVEDDRGADRPRSTSA